TLRIAAAGSDLVGPEGEAARIGFAIEKVEIMLPDEELRGIDRIQSRLVAIENSISIVVDARAPSRADGDAQKSQIGPISGRFQKRLRGNSRLALPISLKLSIATEQESAWRSVVDSAHDQVTISRARLRHEQVD